MKISVVIPVYNEEKYLPVLLKSLHNQDFPKKDYEVIVVDNNSTDATSSIARQYGAKIVKENRQGIAYARDTGTKVAKGEIIFGTDADCVIPHNYLSKIYQAYRKDKDLTGLFGPVAMPDLSDFFNSCIKFLSFYAHLNSKIFKKTPMCWAVNFSFRKRAFDKCNGYNLNLPLLKRGINSNDSEDYIMAKRLEKTGGYVVFNKDFLITTSGRRYKNRFIYWFIVEDLLGYRINAWLYNRFKVIIPVSSYYDRVSPRLFYRYVYGCLAFFCIGFGTLGYLNLSDKTPEIYTEIAEEKIQELLAVSIYLQDKFSP